MRLTDITEQDLIHYLDTTEDRHLGWLERAHHEQNNRTRDYFSMIRDELNRARSSVVRYDIPVLTLYRGLEKPHDARIDGRHWTPVKNIAHDFGKHVYVARVPNEMVDWVATIAHRIGHHHEQEITLIHGAKLKIEMVESLSRWVDVINDATY